MIYFDNFIKLYLWIKYLIFLSDSEYDKIKTINIFN